MASRFKPPLAKRLNFKFGYDRPRIANTTGLELFRKYREPKLGAASQGKRLSPQEREQAIAEMKRKGII